MKTILKTVSTLLILITGSLLSTQALAGDRKTFAGAACEAYRGSQSSDFQATTANTIWNRSNGFRWVKCPILRDRTVNSNGLPRAVAYASHSSTQCRIYSRTATGGARDVQIRNGTVMTFNQINVSSLLGSYHMICRLPRGGHLRSYSVDEYTPTQG